nr:immunoglobulin heavy chain junction region [Macaca mulatta]MOV53324.1 immunoglobulin heavy chain junction region [Macaca mulatta]MOV53354.1 immunoglobulin heavy chain junction region [Macaca mulatta]MOV53748.1 immunoglobulin heavy chain junction region [Macaca mulatta]MOV53802.1 immunoglobulin heavy chain junction region [Macaca mulatta]
CSATYGRLFFSLYSGFESW